MFEGPDWRGDPRQRLHLSLLLAALVLAALLSLFRMPDVSMIAPIGELIVNIVRDDPEPEQVPAPVVEPMIEPAPPVSEPVAEATSQSSSSSEPVETVREWTDWDEVIRDTVAEMAAQEPEPTYSLSPRLDRLREEARVKFRLSEAPVERPIWENVETDLMGRKILRSGDCYKVIDDPNVGSREAFETFGQYIAICAFIKRQPKDLPWVDEINARRAGPSRYGRPSVE